MKKLLALLAFLALFSLPCIVQAETFSYRFADEAQARRLLGANDEFFSSLSPYDLSYRMGREDADQEEYRAFALRQMRSFKKEEKKLIDRAMAMIEKIIADRGYQLPKTDGVVFIKSTMEEEKGAGAYTHGTEVYLAGPLLEDMLASPEHLSNFACILSHELFHCLTRSHPDFRASLYSLIGFSIAEADFVPAPEVAEKIFSNPDVEHHNAYASFQIGKRTEDCYLICTCTRPYDTLSENVFSYLKPMLVSVRDPHTVYEADEADNFFDLFGRNTMYVIDPEEALADNFSYTLLYLDSEAVTFPSQDLLEKIDQTLKNL